jgi:hypothetical protein
VDFSRGGKKATKDGIPLVTAALAMHVLRNSRRLEFSLCLLNGIGGSVSLAWLV